MGHNTNPIFGGSTSMDGLGNNNTNINLRVGVQLQSGFNYKENSNFPNRARHPAFISTRAISRGRRKLFNNRKKFLLWIAILERKKLVLMMVTPGKELGRNWEFYGVQEGKE